MRKLFVPLVLLGLLIAACGTPLYQVNYYEVAPTAADVVPVDNPSADPGTGGGSAAPTATSELEVVAISDPSLVVKNSLVNPERDHFGEDPAGEADPGLFDIGVKPGQIGIVFGAHIDWPQGGLDAGGEGCDLVVLTPGWYENLRILDGRYEVYDIPSSDYTGWVKVLVADPKPATGRAAEQAVHYDCPTTLDHIQVWSDNGAQIFWADWVD